MTYEIYNYMKVGAIGQNIAKAVPKLQSKQVVVLDADCELRLKTQGLPEGSKFDTDKCEGVKIGDENFEGKTKTGVITKFTSKKPVLFLEAESRQINNNDLKIIELKDDNSHNVKAYLRESEDQISDVKVQECKILKNFDYLESVESVVEGITIKDQTKLNTKGTFTIQITNVKPGTREYLPMKFKVQGQDYKVNKFLKIESAADFRTRKRPNKKVPPEFKKVEARHRLFDACLFGSILQAAKHANWFDASGLGGLRTKSCILKVIYYRFTLLKKKNIKRSSQLIQIRYKF